MWTVLLKGNLDLSITMTFISTLAATCKPFAPKCDSCNNHQPSTSFAAVMLPFWMYMLGRLIFNETATKVPISNLLGTLFSMVIFLGIGLLIQKKKPHIAKASISL